MCVAEKWYMYARENYNRCPSSSKERGPMTETSACGIYCKSRLPKNEFLCNIVKHQVHWGAYLGFRIPFKRNKQERVIFNFTSGSNNPVIKKNQK